MFHWRIWSLLVILAFVTTWFLHTLDEKVSIQVVDTLNPDYTVEKFTSTHTDDKGYMSSRLQAEHLTHYARRKTQLTAPHLVFYAQAKPSWFVQAEQGEISANNQEIWLQGEANLWQLDENQQKRIEIMSQNIHVNLAADYAETTAPTTVLMKNGEIHSTGVKLFTKKQRIELLSKVRGHYVIE